MAGKEQGGVVKSERHVVSWDVNVVRNFNPYYTLDMARYDHEPIPPIIVNIAVNFDDHDSALEFERKVREMLESE